MSWRTSNRQSRLPSNWSEIRKEVFRRKGRRCALQIKGVCTGRASQVDHIRPGDDHSLSNLQPVCPDCHKKKSAKEGVSARSRKRQLRRRPPEPHPGDVHGGSASN